MRQIIATRNVPRKTSSNGRRGGFTLIELVIVIVIAGVLMTYAIPRFSGTQQQRVARNARDVLSWTAERARSRAIQTGATQLLQIDPANERAWIVRRNPTVASDTLLTINFVTEYETTLSTSDNNLISICFGPRGYAYAWGATCGSTATSNIDVTFTRGAYTAVGRIKPLGQIERI